MTTHTTPSAIDAIYARVPVVKCRGLCHASCGPIAYSRAEERRIASRCGILPTWSEDLTCVRLAMGRCGIYADRPLVCRLFGAVDHPLMRCPHGCEVVGAPLSDREARALIDEMEMVRS